MEKLQKKLADLQKEQEKIQRSAAWRELTFGRSLPCTDLYHHKFISPLFSASCLEIIDGLQYFCYLYGIFDLAKVRFARAIRGRIGMWM